MSLALMLKPLTALAFAGAVASTALVGSASADRDDRTDPHLALARAGFVALDEVRHIDNRFHAATVRDEATGGEMIVRIYPDGRVITDKPMAAASSPLIPFVVKPAPARPPVTAVATIETLPMPVARPATVKTSSTAVRRTTVSAFLAKPQVLR